MKGLFICCSALFGAFIGAGIGLFGNAPLVGVLAGAVSGAAIAVIVCKVGSCLASMAGRRLW